MEYRVCRYNIPVQHMGKLFGSVDYFSQVLPFSLDLLIVTNFYYQSQRITLKFYLCNKRKQPMRSNDTKVGEWVYVIICWSVFLVWQITWKFYRNLWTLTDFFLTFSSRLILYSVLKQKGVGNSTLANK